MKIVAIILILAYAILYDDVASKAAVKDTLFEKNEINFEFFGHSLGMLSLNYEHTFYNVKNILHLTRPHTVNEYSINLTEMIKTLLLHQLMNLIK